jgi:hypothetical protein
MATKQIPKREERQSMPLSPPEEGSSEVSSFMQLLSKATPEQTLYIRNKLGLDTGPIKRKKRNRMNNAQVQAFVQANGDVVRSDSDYIPLPSEAISDKGPLAVQRFIERWEGGQTVGAMERADMDVIAQEAMSHQADMEAKIDAGTAPSFTAE